MSRATRRATVCEFKQLKEDWSGREDLNLRPPGPEPGALPGCATPRLECIRTRLSMFPDEQCPCHLIMLSTYFEGPTQRQLNGNGRLARHALGQARLGRPAGGSKTR